MCAAGDSESDVRKAQSPLPGDRARTEIPGRGPTLTPGQVDSHWHSRRRRRCRPGPDPHRDRLLGRSRLRRTSRRCSFECASRWRRSPSPAMACCARPAAPGVNIVATAAVRSLSCLCARARCWRDLGPQFRDRSHHYGGRRSKGIIIMNECWLTLALNSLRFGVDRGKRGGGA
jgi:hypothetical protein